MDPCKLPVEKIMARCEELLPGTPVEELLLGRLLHAFGLSRSGGYSFGRFTGTVLTWLVFLAMALAGLWLALR